MRLAAVFISISIFFKSHHKSFLYIEYCGYATLLTTIGVWSYIFANNIQLKPLDLSNLLLIRISIAYLLVEPALFIVLRIVKILVTSSIISMNVLFAFILSLFIFNATFDMKTLWNCIYLNRDIFCHKLKIDLKLNLI